MPLDDPWDWSTELVQSSFVHEFLPAYAVLIPGSKLPDLTKFATDLAELKCTGQSLLLNVDLALLRSECAIACLDTRRTICNAIEVLQSASPGYAASRRLPQISALLHTTLHAKSDSPSAANVPSPQQRLPVDISPGDSLQPSPAVLALAVATETTISSRQNETSVTDAAGKKHRRLVLPQTESASKEANNSRAFNPSSESIGNDTYLRGTAFSIDSLIYGDTPTGAATLETPHADEDDDTMSIVNLSSDHCRGDIKYVYSQISYLMRSAKSRTVSHQGRKTWALFPYRSNVRAEGIPRSLTIFPKLDQDSSGIRVTEHELDHSPPVMALLSNGDHVAISSEDGLSPQHATAVPDKEIAMDDFTDNESEADSAHEREMEEDRQFDIKLKSAVLTREQASDIIDDQIAIYAEDWRDQVLPDLEETKAYGVWRKAGTGRKARERHLGALQQALQHLASRLTLLKDHLLDSQWKAEKEILGPCAALEPTVVDLERRTWELEVCQRTQIPRRSKTHVNTGRAQKTKSSLQNDANDDGFIVPDTESHAHVEPDDSPHGIVNPFIEDEISPASSAHDASAIDTQAAHGDGEDNKVDAVAEVEKADDPVPNDTESIITEPSPPPSVTESAPVSPHVTSPPPSASIMDPVVIDDDDYDFPSPEMLLSQVPTKREASAEESVPKRQKLPMSSPIDAIAISSDESPSPKKVTPRRRKFKIFPKHEVPPEKANGHDIDEWTYDNLLISGDRKRLLMKLLYGMQASELESLAHYFLKPRPRDIADKLVFVLANAIKQNAAIATDIEGLNSAKLYTCWFACDHNYWDRPLDVEAITAPNAADIQAFCDFVVQSLPRLQRMLARLKSSDEDVELDGAEANEDVIISSARKRAVKVDQGAKAARNVAHARMTQFEQHSAGANALMNQSQTSADGGRGVLVNVTKTANEPGIYISDILSRRLKHHQIEGVLFMWREVIESNERRGDGCLLAHTMGLGKTAQAITLLMLIQDAGDEKKTRRLMHKDLYPLKALILCPPGLISNWVQELKKWTQGHRCFNIYVLDSSVNHKGSRIATLEAWDADGGILLIGYPLFRKLVGSVTGDEGDEPAKSKPNKLNGAELADVRRILFESANIVIADEAQNVKNAAGSLNRTVNRIKTTRRVALSGTPLSNNILELYTLLSWASPNYLGSPREFRARYAEPIEAGLWADSLVSERRKGLRMQKLLQHETDPKVHRREYNVLKDSLLAKTEFVLFVPLTDIQRRVYDQFMFLIGEGMSGVAEVSRMQLFGWLSILTLLCNHPEAFRAKIEALLAGMTGSQASATVKEILIRATLEGQSPPGQEDEPEILQLSELKMSETAVRDLLAIIPRNVTPEMSYKIPATRDIIRLAKLAGDKVLLFSQSIPTLNCLERILGQMAIRLGRMDGSMMMAKRNELLADFKKGACDVLLISTRAGGLGLNIQEANRVIIFDFGFNPTWEAQAIGRAYRLGQKKNVFVYRFVVGGTFEEKLYNQGLFKSSLSARVVDSRKPERRAARRIGDWIVPPNDVPQMDINVEGGKDPKVMDVMIGNQSAKTYDYNIRDIKTMETLTQEVEEPLNEEETREVTELLAMYRAQQEGRLSGAAYQVPTNDMGQGYAAPDITRPDLSQAHYMASQRAEVMR